jgi:hypothetical protein
VGGEVIIMGWINGAVCAGFVAVPFVVMAAVGLRNALREKHARPDVSRYERRWRVTYVARASRDA